MFELPIIPEMKCDRGCGECCGVVPASTAEYAAVRDHAERHGIVPLSQGLTCPWYQEGTCAVYKVRPTVCRLYGHVDDPHMTCPRGYNVNMKRRDVEKYSGRMTPKGGVRLLHEILPNWEAVLGI